MLASLLANLGTTTACVAHIVFLHAVDMHVVIHITRLQGPDITIHHPQSVLDNMNDWCKEHHTKSGLVQRVKDSTTSLREAEQKVRAAGPCF
jgi:oligoribonuclease (3'-5' exoribonuclease)